MPKASKTKKKVLLGVGLDSDGHKRVTTAPDMVLIGGGAETHEAMTEKALKIKEKLSARGKTLDTASPEEFDDIAQSVGLSRVKPS
jgi:hypothetical protein